MIAIRRTLVPAVAVVALAARIAVAEDAPDTSADDARVKKLALVLRAEDRRIVDDSLRGLLADPDGEIRARAAAAYGQIGDRATAAEVAALTKDTDTRVRAAAAFALGLIGETAPRDPLHLLVVDSSPAVRGSAADALGRI